MGAASGSPTGVSRRKSLAVRGDVVTIRTAVQSSILPERLDGVSTDGFMACEQRHVLDARLRD